jgi:hypothetical protein
MKTLTAILFFLSFSFWQTDLFFSPVMARISLRFVLYVKYQIFINNEISNHLAIV